MIGGGPWMRWSKWCNGENMECFGVSTNGYNIVVVRIHDNRQWYNNSGNYQGSNQYLCSLKTKRGIYSRKYNYLRRRWEEGHRMRMGHAKCILRLYYIIVAALM